MAGTEDRVGERARRAVGIKAWRKRRLTQRPVSWLAVEEIAGTGPGQGASGLGFVGYDPARARVTEPGFAELGFLAPRKGLAAIGDRTPVSTAVNGPTAAGF